MKGKRFILYFLLFGFINLSGIFPAFSQAEGGRPNILWLVTEDISPYIPCYGDSTAQTPNLDRLAREGVKFTNFFSVSGVCAPSRSAIITGMYPTCIGTDNMRTVKTYPEIKIPSYSVVLPPEVKMFSELMRRAGYYCTNNGKEDYQFNAPLSGWDENGKNAHWRNRPKDKPFFAVFNIGITHESQIWLKKNDPLLVDPAKVKLPPYYPESPVIRRDMARMYSNIMEMDKQVGAFLKQLEDEGLLDKTIVIWYSDNGGPLPRGKREIYDSGIKVPMLIRYPDKRDAGTVNNELVSFVDLAPSMLSLAGAEIPGYIQGQAFLGARKAPSRQYIYAARDRMDTEYDMVRAVRDSRYKYIKNFQPEKPFMQQIKYRMQMDLMKELLRFEKEGRLNEVQRLWFRKTKPEEELYDTQNDPYELNNLASDPKYAAKLQELREALSAWMTMTDDKGFIPERQWVESMWPGMVQPVTPDPVPVMEKEGIAIPSPIEGASVSWQLVKAGAAPEKNKWQLYTGPVKPARGMELIAVAERIGYKGSNIVRYAPE